MINLCFSLILPSTTFTELSCVKLFVHESASFVRPSIWVFTPLSRCGFTSRRAAEKTENILGTGVNGFVLVFREKRRSGGWDQAEGTRPNVCLSLIGPQMSQRPSVYPGRWRGAWREWRGLAWPVVTIIINERVRSSLKTLQGKPRLQNVSGFREG